MYNNCAKTSCIHNICTKTLYIQSVPGKVYYIEFHNFNFCPVFTFCVCRNDWDGIPHFSKLQYKNGERFLLISYSISGMEK